MEAELPSRGAEILSALAGPAGSFLLLSLYRVAPHIAICGLIQGMYNLLPVYPLDGGRALRRAMEGRLENRTIRWVEGIFLALSAAAAMQISFGIAIFLVIRWILVKIPCKRRQIGLQ